MVQYISKQRKGAVEMTSPDLKLNLPKRDHQKDTRSGVYVTPVKKCVKATAQSQQDATQIRKKVATVPLEIMEELVRDVGELRDMPTGNVVVQGRSEKNMKADVCPTGGHHNILRFDKGYCGCVPAVSLPITNTAVMLRVVEKYKEVKHTGVEYLPALQSSWNMAEELCHGLHCACALQEVYATSDMVKKTMWEKREEDIVAVLKDNCVRGRQVRGGFGGATVEACGSFLLPFEGEVRGGRVEEQVQGAQQEGRVSGEHAEEGEVLADADEPHLPTSCLGVYWMATSATNRLH